MDVTTLAKDLISFLAPFLPYLLKAGEKAAEEVGRKLGGDAWEKAKTLWGKLRPKVEAKPAAREAVQEMATYPDDADAQAALRLQLRRILAEDETLTAEVTRLWQEAKVAGVTVIDSGKRSVAVGSDVKDSVIVTGNQNVVQQGKYNVSIGAAEGIAVGDQARVEMKPGRKPVVTRYTDIACPRQIWINTPRISVVVRLTVQPEPYSAVLQALEIEQLHPIQVRLTAPAFKLLSPTEQEIEAVPEADSPPLVFDLQPQQVGLSRLTFDFAQRGAPLGTVSVPIEVTNHQVVEVPAPSPAMPIRLPEVSPPDLLLYIHLETDSHQTVLIFTLIAPSLGIITRTFQPVPIIGSPAQRMTQLYANLSALISAKDPLTKRFISQEELDAQVRDLGYNLWRELIPEDLKLEMRMKWEEWRDKALIVASDEPYFPWELIRPYASNWEGEPWCEHFRMTRWLRRDAQGNGHEAPSVLLRVRRFACLAPADSGLKAAQGEQIWIQQFISSLSIMDLTPHQSTRAAMRRLLEDGQYDWIHIAAHGDFVMESPDGYSAVWLTEGEPLTPQSFVGPQIERHIRQCRPGFFLNACHTGREGWALTRLDGWAARLISMGAGVFIGPLWTVSDEAAHQFAEAFYQAVQSYPLGEALRQARQVIKVPGDPTYLAYTLYAHPNAVLRFGKD